MNAERPRRVVLVGGGHCHIQVIQSFGPSPPGGCRLTLVVDRPTAVYSGMIPGFVAGRYREKELEIDVEGLARRAGFQVVIDRAAGWDPEAREILLESGSRVAYDVASIDIGSLVAGLDTPGVREHAIPTRPINDFKDRIKQLFINLNKISEKRLDAVVVGGGAGGVELAFTLKHRLEAARAGSSSVTLVNQGSRLLPGAPEGLRRRVVRLADRRGIRIRNRCRVTAVFRDWVTVNDAERMRCQLVLWVTGPQGQPLLREAGLPTEERGFVWIRSTLQVEGRDELFAVGDCATLRDHPRTPKAGVYAVRQGPYLTENLKAYLEGRPLRTYRPQADFLTLLNVGGGRAVGSKWGLCFEGNWVMALKDAIDRKFMRRFQSA